MSTNKTRAPVAAVGRPGASPLISERDGDLAIETTGLVKHFGTTRAVDGLDLQVPIGAIYGVLGPNGAGKTTAIRMLATLLRPTSGTARVFGHDIVEEADGAATGQHDGSVRVGRRGPHGVREPRPAVPPVGLRAFRSPTTPW